MKADTKAKIFKNFSIWVKLPVIQNYWMQGQTSAALRQMTLIHLEYQNAFMKYDRKEEIK